MVEYLRADDGSWHVGVDAVGVYIAAYRANPINISVQDAREIAHAILELTDVKDSTDKDTNIENPKKAVWKRDGWWTE